MTAMEKLEKKMKSLLSARYVCLSVWVWVLVCMHPPMQRFANTLLLTYTHSGGRPGWSVSVVEAFAQFYIRQGVEYAEMKPLDMSQMHASVQRQTQSARPPVLLLLEGRSKPTTSVDCRGTQCVASYQYF